MFKTLLCDEANQFRVVEDPSAISDIVQNKQHHLWLDIERPTQEDFDLIQEEFGLHPLAIEDALMRHQRPKVEQYDDFYLVVFYSVGIVKPGDALSPTSRVGLRGTRFLRRTGDSLPDGSANSGEHDHARNNLPLPNGKPREEAASGADEERVVLREITMFMGENYLITVHTDPVPELDEAAERWERNIDIITPQDGRSSDVPGTRPLNSEERRDLRKGSRGQPAEGLVMQDGKDGVQGAGQGKQQTDGRGSGRQGNDIGILLYSLLDSIVDNYFPVMDSIVDRSEELEEQIFAQYNQQAIEGIFTLKKDLLALRKVFAPERDVLNVLIRRDLPIFEQHTLVYFQDVYDHVVRITDSIDTYRDLLSSALDSFLSMQSNRLNVTVQTLTSFSIILMSVAAVAGWYGMNFTMMPELNSALGYPGVIVVVVSIVIIEVIFFKRKGWL